MRTKAPDHHLYVGAYEEGQTDQNGHIQRLRENVKYSKL